MLEYCMVRAYNNKSMRFSINTSTFYNRDHDQYKIFLSTKQHCLLLDVKRLKEIYIIF